MQWFTRLKAAWQDLRKGPGSFAERVERNADVLLVVVLILATAVRLVFVWKFHGELYSRREKGFWLMAWNWVQGKGLSISTYCPTSYRAPLYVFFVIPFLEAFKLNYTWPLGLAQLIISVANVFLTYRIGAAWKSKRVGLIGAFIMALYPYNLYHDTQFYITFLFTFFLLLTVLGFMKMEQTRAWQYAALTGVAIGLAMLATSGPMVFFAPLACLWLWRRIGSLKTALKLSAIAAGMALLVMSPWMVRNIRLHHHFVPLTTDAGRVFYKSYNPWAMYMLMHDITVDSTPEPGEGVLTPMMGEHLSGCGFLGMSEYDNEHYWYGKTWSYVEAHPAEAPQLVLVKFTWLWRPAMWPPKDAAGDNSSVILSAQAEDWAYSISFGFILFLSGFEFLAETKEERKRSWLFVSLAIAFSITYSLTVPFSKYRIPLDFILAVMAAAGTWRWIEGWNARKNAAKK